MAWFRNFTMPVWEIFGGNLLMLTAIVFYIAWWAVSFWPYGDGKIAGAGLFISVALLTGVAAIGIMSHGISALPQTGKGLPVLYILLGAVAFFIISLAVTRIVFQREVTSELLLITVWAALELSIITVLHGSGRFGMGNVWALTAVVALATVTGMVCYVLHYRLDDTGRFWNGLIPLAADTFAVTVILAVQALS